MSAQRISNGSQTIKSEKISALPCDFSKYSVAHVGHPERNEDYMVIDKHTGLVAIFDGVGSAFGDVASRIAARAIRRRWKQFYEKHCHAEPFTFDPDVDLQSELCKLVDFAREQVLAEITRREKRGEASPVIATTVAFAILSRTKIAQQYTMTYAHVGDSRVYLLRSGTPILRLTMDDGLLAQGVKEQTLSEEDALRIDQATAPDQLSEDEFALFKKRNGITQDIGYHKSITVHVNSIPLMPGDQILFCTDGIHDNLLNKEIEEIMRGNARAIARALVLRAQECSKQGESVYMRAKDDDMSAIVVTYKSPKADLTKLS
jgi:serine/threonine protein phosphatase PrpC